MLFDVLHFVMTALLWAIAIGVGALFLVCGLLAWLTSGLEP